MRLSLIILATFLASATAHGQFSPSVTPGPVTCPGDTDGMIHVEVAEGTAPYLFILLNNQMNEQDRYEGDNSSHIFEELAPGTYRVWIEDAEGNDAYFSEVVVSEPDDIIVGVLPDPADICLNTVRQLNGQYSGGNGKPYTHLWTGNGAGYLNNTGIENPEFTSGDRDMYYLTYRVEDHKGCWSEETISIEVFETITAGFTHKNVTCYEGNNGSITVVNVDGGSGDYEYMIDGSDWQDTPDFEGLTAGDYNIWIRDALYPDDCTVLAGREEITQPDLLTANISHTDVTCNGGANGSITISLPEGGSGDYQYRITGFDWQSAALFDGLAAGNYVVEIRDANNTDCFTELDGSYAISEPDLLTANISHTDVTCNGGANGSITISLPEGGSGDYQYRITGFDWQTGGLFEGLTAGNYVIEIRDANDTGCVTELDGSYAISEPDLLTATISHTDVTCNGSANGSITISSPQGGSGSWEYRISGFAWQPGGLFEGLTAGNYVIEIRDAAETGCIIELDGSYTISEPDLLTADITHTNVTCNGSANGTITISSPQGGSGDYQYRISGFDWQTGGLFEGLTAGNYVIEIRDANNTDCFTELDGSYGISEPDLLTADITHTDATCNGSANGSITISSPQGGSGSWEYRISGFAWQPGGLFEGLTAGNYVVEIRDVADTDCVTELDGSYTISEPAILTATISHTDVTCSGSANGSITISLPEGGSGDYQYRITGFDWQSAALFDGLAAGNYVVEIRDANNTDCFTELDGSFTVQEPSELAGSIDHEDVTVCSGYSNGWIEINASGSWAEATGNYEYTIDGGESWSVGNRFENLKSGYYDVQVRDAGNPGCFLVINDNFFIDQPEEITADIYHEPVSCNGGSDGMIRFDNVTGGSGDYYYTIIGYETYEQSNNTFNELPAGVYDLRISDLVDENCIVIIDRFFSLSEPGELNASVSKSDVTGCHGNDNGEITVFAMEGGSGNFQYSADDGISWQDDNHFTSLTAGTYPVWIRDADATECIKFLESIEITEPQELQAGFDVNDASCFGGTDGRIVITDPLGGSGSYEFSADGGFTWQEELVIGSLASGVYTVSIRDSNSPVCEIVLGSATVGEPDEIAVNVTAITGNDCYGSYNGTIRAIASGGTADYIYSLYEGDGFIASLEPLHPDPAVFEGLPAAGNYRIVVTDSRGCDPAEVAGIVITEPDELVVSPVDVEHIDCYGAETGKITINASGGTGDILYSVNGIDFYDNGGVFENLPAGIFEVEVKDGNGCITDYGTVEITEPDRLAAAITAIDITCHGAENGRIQITNPEGGTLGSYEYSIDGMNWFADPLFENLSAGIYNVYMLDADAPGCFVELDDSPLEVTEPEELEMTVSPTHVDCQGNASGMIEIIAEGGNGDYEYRLDGGEWQAGPAFGELTPGTYLVETRDRNDCLVNETVEITEPEELKIFNIGVNNETCFDAKDGKVTITPEGGRSPYLYSIDGGDTFQEDNIFTGLAPGFYDVSVMDSNGCMVNADIPARIRAAREIVFERLDVYHVSCNGAGDGELDIEASGGETSLQYSIDYENWQDNGNFTNLEGGNYTVWVKDIRNCTVAEELTVIEPDPLTIDVSVDDIACSGAGNGIVYASAVGGSVDYTYTLYYAETGLVAATEQISAHEVEFSGLESGDYYVVAVDANGCNSGQSVIVTVTDPEELIISLVDAEDISCHGADDGIITITAAGGTGELMYSVDGGVSYISNGGAFTGLTAGSYNIVVTDEKGCETVAPDPVEINEPDEIELTSSDVTPAQCHGTLTGSISVTAAGGIGELEYSLDGESYQAEGNFGSLSGGDYTLYVRDGNLCIKMFDFFVPQPEELVLTAQVLNSVCREIEEDPEIRARATGGTAPYVITLYLDGAEQASFDNIGEDEWVLFESLIEDETGYEVVAADDSGCQPVSSGMLSTEMPEELGAGLSSVSRLECHGVNEGEIEILITGGTAPYFVQLYLDGAPAADIDASDEAVIFDGLGAGTYSVSVTDLNGCGPVTIEDIHIETPDELVFGDFSLSHNTCAGYSDGAIETEAHGGTGSYVFTLLNAENEPVDGYEPLVSDRTAVFADLPAGIYRVGLTDENGCGPVISAVKEIVEPEPLDIQVYKTDISCHGQQDGSITIQVDGGTGAIEFSIDGGVSFHSNGGVFEDLGQGSYEIVVRDSNSCNQNAGIIEIADPDPVEILSTDHDDDIRCYADDPHSGFIRISATGGTGTLEYSIDGGISYHANEGQFENIEKGTYLIYVRDANGCFIQGDTIIIEGADPPSIDTLRVSDILCHGEADGMITIIASGNNVVLEYSIDGGNNFYTEGNFIGLNAGKYGIVLRHDLGCVVPVDTVEITQPEEIEFVNVQAEDIITGSGNEHGAITMEVIGGVGPYLYSIDDGSSWQEENVFVNLPAGQYNIIVSDDNGCTAVTSAEILEVTGINASISTYEPVCNGDGDGFILVTGELGTEPYEYSIDGGNEFLSSGNFTGLSAGTYMIVVKDDAGYEYHETVELNDPDPIEITSVIKNASCSNFHLDGPDGGIELEVTGGTGSYSYLWSTGEVTKYLQDIPAGDYSIVIADENECEKTFDLTVDYNNLVEVTMQELITICPGEDVRLEPSVNSSSSSVTYSWLASELPDPDSVMSPVVAPTLPAYYSLRVMDDNNCYDDAEVHVDIYPLQGLSIGNDTMVYQGSTIMLEARGGEFVNYEWTPSGGLSDISGPVTTAVVTDEITYYLYAETAEGCMEYDSVFIGIILPIELVSGFTPNSDGINDHFEIPNAQDYPDIVVEIYNRAGQRVFYSEGYSDDKRWDGTYNGRELPMGTYYYVITLNDEFGTRPVTGPVTIVR